MIFWTTEVISGPVPSPGKKGMMGLSGTDHKCLELVIRAPAPITAGQIAQQSGLSTGAVTGVIDRLA